jgi:toxin HigB-1
VILSYRDKRTRSFAGKTVNAFSGFERAARMKLDRLQAATSLRDLAALPVNRFELLKGDRQGQFSIRINDRGGFALSGRVRRWDLPTSKS